MSRAREEAGMTIVEVLVATVTMLIVLAATMSGLIDFSHQNDLHLRQAEAQDNARRTLDRMARELRNVQPQTQALERATGTDLIFQAVNGSQAPGAGAGNAANVQRVRYCLSGSTLYRQVQTWTSTPPVLTSATTCPFSGASQGTWATATSAATGVRNGATPVFAYNNSSTPTSSSILNVTVIVDADVGQAPAAATLTSSVSLRNQRQSPTAAFTWTSSHTGNTVVHLDASGSTSPTGQPLTYSWTVDGNSATCPKQNVTIDCDVGTAGAHSVMLTVSDPGGLQAYQTQSVTP